jgi:hypothetical protein
VERHCGTLDHRRWHLHLSLLVAAIDQCRHAEKRPRFGQRNHLARFLGIPLSSAVGGITFPSFDRLPPLCSLSALALVVYRNETYRVIE